MLGDVLLVGIVLLIACMIVSALWLGLEALVRALKRK
jgi:hypothetical protein